MSGGRGLAGRGVVCSNGGVASGLGWEAGGVGKTGDGAELMGGPRPQAGPRAFGWELAPGGGGGGCS